MPAKHLSRISEENTYSHIYNKGVENRIIFKDSEDYEVFQGFLKNYLTASAEPSTVKKEFTVNGRTFRGTPHLPKNYFGKVELIAYSLAPDHFHLLLNQKSKGSIQSFIRSLCTRYSMYFNKKHQRTGALFNGPYKSVHIKDKEQLLPLTHFIHSCPKNGETISNNSYSSYFEYLGERKTSWVNPTPVLLSKSASEYKKYVEGELGEKEKELLEGVTLEINSKPLERTILAGETENNPFKEPTQLSRIPEVVGVATVLLVLVTLGIRNIHASTNKVLGISATPVATFTPPPAGGPTPTPEPKKMVVIKITDGAEKVNIRQNPTVGSEKIGEALDGQKFEFVSLNSNWYEVKLASGGNGFILSAYAFVEGGNK